MTPTIDATTITAVMQAYSGRPIDATTLGHLEHDLEKRIGLPVTVGNGMWPGTLIRIHHHLPLYSIQRFQWDGQFAKEIF